MLQSFIWDESRGSKAAHSSALYWRRNCRHHISRGHAVQIHSDKSLNGLQLAAEWDLIKGNKLGKRQSKIAAKLKQQLQHQCLLQQLIQEFVCLLAAHGRGRSAQSLRRIMANQEGLKAAAGGAFVGTVEKQLTYGWRKS